MEGRTVLLIRHGSVDSLAVGHGVPCIYGPHEPLSTHGMHQSIRLAENLANQGIHPDLIFSSQYERAYQTANLLHEKFPGHPPVIPDAQFNGARTPQWDHRPATELGLVKGNFFADNPMTPDIHGETLAHAYERVISEYKRVLESHKSGSIAIVTHDEVIGMILHYLKTGDQGTPGVESSIEKGEALILSVNTEGKVIDSQVVTPEGVAHHKEKK